MVGCVGAVRVTGVTGVGVVVPVVAASSEMLAQVLTVLPLTVTRTRRAVREEKVYVSAAVVVPVLVPLYTCV